MVVTDEGMNMSGSNFRLLDTQMLSPDSRLLSRSFALVSYAVVPLCLNFLLL